MLKNRSGLKQAAATWLFIFAANHPALRYPWILLFCITSLFLPAQHHYQYDLHSGSNLAEINGKAKIWFVNHTARNLEKIMIHLPPGALSWKGSFFHQQHLEFQKTDLHYADRDQSGYIEIEDLRIEADTFKVCQQCEFTEISLDRALAAGDSLLIELEFHLILPKKDWLGSYYRDGDILLTDWLPEIPPFDSTGYHLYPETWQRDRFAVENRYSVSWTLPDSLIVASNARLITGKKLAEYDSISKVAFRRASPTKKPIKLEFRHTGTGLQFIASPDFYLFRMANGGRLFLQVQDPFLPAILDTVNKRINRFMKSETGRILAENYDLAILKNYHGHFQSDHLISLQQPGSAFELARELTHARFQSAIRYRDGMNGFAEVWLARGLPYYYKYRFIETEYPEEYWTPWQDILTRQFWQPLAHGISGWLLSLRQFEYAYQNQYLYLFLARQGLDQPLNTPADSLTRLNYGAVPLAKSYLALNHLRAYTGESDFKRGMHRFLRPGSEMTANSLHQSISYFHNRNLSWFFEDWLSTEERYDFKFKNYDYCPTVATAKVKNVGSLKLPYSITGYREDQPVITEWFEGHSGERTQQLYHEEYDFLRLNDHGQNAEWNLKDNYYRRGLFPHLKPVKLQFYQTFEDPRSTQIFWMPGLAYNAYDKVLLRLDLYNYGLVTRPWEWYLGPSFSTGQGQLTGSASLERNFTPKSSSRFHRISAGIYMRYYHYDQDLAFFRLSPSVSFRFRKPYPRSTILQRVRLRAVHLERELGPEFDGVANDISNASYTVVNLTHRYEETRLTRPYTIRTDLLLGNQFSRIDLSADFRWMLPNRRWLIWRSFGGLFMHNEFAELGEDQNYYSLGLSGTQDFMFDYYFIGRSDQSGIWSRQFFVTDGGFKTETDLFANQWMLATNLNLPVWQFFGLFGDLGLADGFEKLHYDYGIRLAFLTDFLEIYFPLGYNDRFFPAEYNYPGNIRYVLNLDLDAILHRLRRGYY